MAPITIMNVMALSSMSFAIFDRLFIITVLNMAIVVAMAITAGMATLDVMDIIVCMTSIGAISAFFTCSLL